MATWVMVSEPSVSVRPSVTGTAMAVSSLPPPEPEPVGASATAATIRAWLEVVVAVSPLLSVVVTPTVSVTLPSEWLGVV